MRASEASLTGKKPLANGTSGLSWPVFGAHSWKSDDFGAHIWNPMWLKHVETLLSKWYLQQRFRLPSAAWPLGRGEFQTTLHQKRMRVWFRGKTCGIIFMSEDAMYHMSHTCREGRRQSPYWNSADTMFCIPSMVNQTQLALAKDLPRSQDDHKRPQYQQTIFQAGHVCISRSILHGAWLVMVGYGHLLGHPLFKFTKASRGVGLESLWL